MASVEQSRSQYAAQPARSLGLDVKPTIISGYPGHGASRQDIDSRRDYFSGAQDGAISQDNCAGDGEAAGDPSEGGVGYSEAEESLRGLAEGSGAEDMKSDRGTGDKDQKGQTNSQNGNSDDDPAAMDERKQKRMLSNRESARRSRLRKQQHLDELRGQVAQLRAENTDMLNKYNIATRHYTQLTEENRALRSHAMELSRRLQRLHHQAAAQGHPGSHELLMGHPHFDPSVPIPRLW